MRYLLDTNACIGLLRKNPKLLDRMKAAHPADFAISSVSAFELHGGLLRTRHPVREAECLRQLFGTIPVLPFDRTPAQAAAAILHGLEKRGTPIGPYDTLIAGHAVALGLTLITHNTREFSRVKGLALEDWEA